MNQNEEVRLPFLLPMLAELELGVLDKAVLHFIFGLVLIGSILAVLVVVLRFVFSCFKRGKSDRVLVIYGLGIKAPGRCVHGRTSFVWPIFQDHQFLDLTPIPMAIKVVEGVSKDGIKVMVEMTCTIGIATETGVVEKAAERLLGLNLREVRMLGQDIVLEEMLAVISSLHFEPIDGNLLLERSAILIQPKLEEVGFRLININIQRISRATKGGEVEMGEE